MLDVFDKEGNLIDTTRWRELAETYEYQHIAYTELPDGKRVINGVAGS